ncbi:MULTISPECIES: XrtA/PEP-CTERM system histidine kinase PrsK [Nitrosomonas]|uniref:histidine kinase n=1 Tax=Nitrosomonas communis TaxID=44574 RepID=A0A0F7KFI2_9PROT|nr:MULTISPECIES: XrtA/PEP-CTERM system histidine kinase PrsK [Nitrosomonas]AKH37527.1 histidine kinase [Nitrosomonas communis]TYP92367.1 putative PEP-CTERM system histidine kinase [Nitrosomonas communis]UVS62779.1 PEP-CTERM system histidine kinase PrsK [Nitrosomonas sp. PLL12]
MWATITAASYVTAAVAYLFLFVLLLTNWRGRLYGSLLAIVCIVSAFWAVAIASQSYWGFSLTFLIEILEILRNAGWSIFLIALLNPFQQRKENSIPLKIRPAVAAIAVLYLIFFILAIFFNGNYDGEFTSHGQPASYSTFFTGVIMAVIGMVLVEQYYRNMSSEQRWRIKLICLGIGGIFVYDFYLFSDALLFRKVNSDIWIARGWVDALTVPLIALAVARNPKWFIGICISRHILFYTSALLSAVIYLLVMAAVGYYLRLSGGAWGGILQLTFLFGAVLLLIILLFSDVTRAWLKVFISKHFYSSNYDYREEWLRFTRTLSEGELELTARAIKALAQLVESPAGGLWFRQENGRYQLIGCWNIFLKNKTIEADNEFCKFLEEKAWVIDLQEFCSDPRKYSSLVLPNWLSDIPRARLIVPLILHRELLGFIVLVEPRSTISLNWEVRDLLRVAGTQASSYLAQYEAANALSIARQFESFNRMSTFVVHDIKNLIFQLSLLLSNAEKHKNNPEFQKDMIETVSFSVSKMKRLLEKLSTGNQSEKLGILSLDQLLQQIMERKSFHIPKPALEITHSNLMVMADYSRLERVISHLIQNAIEATPKNGQVWVRLLKKDSSALIEIEDNGHGMSEQFIQKKLFKPFESTKTAGMGIGVFESKEYINELGGQLDVVSQESAGTTFSIYLPLSKNYQENKVVS